MASVEVDVVFRGETVKVQQNACQITGDIDMLQSNEYS